MSQLVAYRAAGKSFREIAEIIGEKNYRYLAAYAQRVLPKHLQGAIHTFERDLPPELLAEYRARPGWTWRMIADATHFTTARVRAYAERVLTSEQRVYRRKDGGLGKSISRDLDGKCYTCGLPGELANLIYDATNECMRCMLVAAGFNLRNLHLAGWLPLLDMPEPELVEVGA